MRLQHGWHQRGHRLLQCVMRFVETKQDQTFHAFDSSFPVICFPRFAKLMRHSRRKCADDRAHGFWPQRNAARVD